MKKKIFLLRHADYNGSGPDPSLSDSGKQQAVRLAEALKREVGQQSVAIWTSSAARANETAQIIKQEMSLANMVVEEKLWSDNKHRHDFEWLSEKIASFEKEPEENLIIVSHLEYVRQFPQWQGYQGNNAGYAEGVKYYEDIYTTFPG